MNKIVYQIASLVLACAMIFGDIIHTQAAGSVYYVSPTGSDTNPGTSAAPFKTFAKANSMLTAGSTLNIYAGTYKQQLKISKSGTSSAWINVRPLGGAVVIDMLNAATTGLDVRASYVSVSGLEVKNSSDACVNLLGSNITVDGIVVHECRNHGIQANNSSQIKILNSRVYRAVLTNASRSLSGGWGSGIKVRLSDSVLIQGNTVYNNYGEGMGTRGTNVTIRANTVYDNFSVNIYTNSENALIERNFVYCRPNSGFERNGLPATGIGMGEEYFEGWGARLKNAKVINNIVTFCKHGVRYNGAEAGVVGGGLKNATIAYNTLYGSKNSALAIVYASAQAGSLIANNIIWQAENKLASIDNPVGLTFQNNLWKVAPPVALRSPGDRIGDPNFVSTPDYTAESYRLASSSTAVGAAVDSGISSDFYSKTRGPAYDIGAIQVTSGSLAPLPTTTASPIPPTVQPTNTVPPTTQATASPVPPTIQPTNTNPPTVQATASSVPPTTTAVPAITASPLPSSIAPSPSALPPTALPTQTNPPAATSTTAPTNSVSGNSFTFTPVADSYVASEAPNRNYGTIINIRVDGSPIIRSYLRFNVQGLNGTPTKVTLRVLSNDSASAGISVSGVSDNSWTETGITYNNAPPIGNTLGSSGSIGSPRWVNLDITAYVTGNGTYNLALTTPGNAAISIGSRESDAKDPQLIIQTAP